MPSPSLPFRPKPAKKNEADSRMKKLLKKILTAPFVALAAIIVLVEDWLWDDLQRLAAAIGRLPLLRQLERLIVSLPPYGALTIFAAPSLLLIPVKLLALYFLSHDQPLFGFLVAAAAKVVGTALVARIYQLTEAKLLLIGWFAWLHTRFVTFKTRLYATLKATRIYQTAHRLAERVRHALAQFRQRRRAFWRLRWESVLKLSRRAKQPEP